MFIHDPVCGKRINRNKAHIAFERDPETYVRAVKVPVKTHRK